VIPVDVDVVAILSDLRRWGWRDQKIEVACGFSSGYVDKLRNGARPMRPYQHVARLYNFWESEESANRQTLDATSG
jgi:hypothetical protein